MNSRVLILCLWLSALDAQAALIEAVVQIPVEVTDEHRRPHQQQITVTIFRDDAREKSPFLVLNHGRAGTAAERLQLGRVRYTANSEYFASAGFAVFVPTRVGYGVSGGPDVEDTGPCNNRDYPRGIGSSHANAGSSGICETSAVYRRDAGTVGGSIFRWRYNGCACREEP